MNSTTMCSFDPLALVPKNILVSKASKTVSQSSNDQSIPKPSRAISDSCFNGRCLICRDSAVFY
jgi:hypothetical protein